MQLYSIIVLMMCIFCNVNLNHEHLPNKVESIRRYWYGQWWLQEYFPEWSLRNSNYKKFNKNIISYIGHKFFFFFFKNTYMHKDIKSYNFLFEFSYFEIFIWYSYYQCCKLHFFFQNFSSIKIFLGISFLFVRT